MNTQEITEIVRKCRDETASICHDYILSDGTVLYSKEQNMERLAEYDRLLSVLNRRED